ncbi:MAG: hypothetical protein Q8Q02_08955 [Nocardioides sp.]|nr:hypothetical protein [Nocardioides sp.]
MSDAQDDRPADAADDVGSVGEEAAKLFGALSDWARTQGTTQAGGAADAAAGFASVLGSVNEHVATEGEDCRYCPVCQVIHAVRSTSPEVRANLSTAATSLLHAAAGMLATQVPPEREGGRRGPVEHIDLTDEESWVDEDGED